jgi:hypothetical protein
VSSLDDERFYKFGLAPGEIALAARLGHTMHVDDDGVVSCSCGDWPLEVLHLSTPEEFDVHARRMIEISFPEGDMRGSPAVWLVCLFIFVLGVGLGILIGWWLR